MQVVSEGMKNRIVLTIGLTQAEENAIKATFAKESDCDISVELAPQRGHRAVCFDHSSCYVSNTPLEWSEMESTSKKK